MVNETQFHILVPDRASVWRALAAVFRSELLDPRGVSMEDITDLVAIVRFCRAHGESADVPVRSDGRCSLEVLASLFERTAAICERSGDDLVADLAAVQDFSIVFGYRSKDTLTETMIRALRPIAASPFARRYVTRGAVDPNNEGVAYSCELELIDPLELKEVDAKLIKLVKQHVDNPDAYLNDSALVTSYIEGDGSAGPAKNIHATMTFEEGFISQYAIHTMQLVSAAIPRAGIFGGTPDDAALPATVPLCENNQYVFQFTASDKVSSSQRALDFLDMLLFGGLLGDPDAPEEDIESGAGVTLTLANNGRGLLPLKDHLAPGSEVAQIIDELVLNRGLVPASTYRILARALVLGGLDIPKLSLGTNAAVRVRDPASTTASGATLVRALEAYNNFRAQAYRDFPEEREALGEIFDGASALPAHVAIDRDSTTGECSLYVDVHWSYNGYFTVALEQQAKEKGFSLREPEEPNVFVVS